MAKSIRESSGSDWAISTTGVAGPGEDAEGNPEGLFFVSVVGKHKIHVKKFQVGGDRIRIRRYATMAALNELKLIIKQKK